MPIALDPTFLDARQVPSGGYAPFPGEPARADATAWALLAGRPACQGRAEDWEFLASNQEPSGAVVLLPEGRKSGWVTSVAILAWLASGQAPEAAEKAVRYLLEMGGEKRDVPQPSIVAHDVNLRGWPWIEGTFPWVDTTALALVALRAADRSREERFREGKKLLLNRQLPSGGWNYGNTMVYGAELRPTPESTGAALFALAGETSEQEVAASLDYLENVGKETATPLTLAWMWLALRAWNREKPPSPPRSWGSLDRMPTEWLALLLLARSGWSPA